MNKAAITFACSCLCGHMFSKQLVKSLGIQLVDHIGRLSSALWETASFPTWLYRFASLSSMNESSRRTVSSSACGAVLLLFMEPPWHGVYGVAIHQRRSHTGWIRVALRSQLTTGKGRKIETSFSGRNNAHERTEWRESWWLVLSENYLGWDCQLRTESCESWDDLEEESSRETESQIQGTSGWNALNCLKTPDDRRQPDWTTPGVAGPAATCAGQETSRADHGGALNFIPNSAECHLRRLTFYNMCFFLCLQGTGIFKCGWEENNKEATVTAQVTGDSGLDVATAAESDEADGEPSSVTALKTEDLEPSFLGGG